MESKFPKYSQAHGARGEGDHDGEADHQEGQQAQAGSNHLGKKKFQKVFQIS